MTLTAIDIERALAAGDSHRVSYTLPDGRTFSLPLDLCRAALCVTFTLSRGHITVAALTR